MDSPLSDLVVLDLTRALSGPIASRLLADLGADVIKVEPPDGDLTRTIVPHVGGISPYYRQYNTGKRCVSIDLSDPAAGAELLLAHGREADVVLENYRPGVMARLGCPTRRWRPAIRASSWRRSAPGSRRLRSRSRRLRVGDPRRDRRDRAGGPAPGHARRAPQRPDAPRRRVRRAARAGRAARRGTLRDRTGRGQAVEVSMAESTLMANDLASIELSGVEPEVGFRAGQNWSPVFQLANGRHVSITLDCGHDGGSPRCGAPPSRQAEWAQRSTFRDLREAGWPDRAPLEAGIGRWVARLDSARGAPWPPSAVPTLMVADVSTVPELAASDWAAERGAFVVVAGGRRRGGRGAAGAVALQSRRQRGWCPRSASRGEHNREVLHDLLGLSDERASTC